MKNLIVVVLAVFLLTALLGLHFRGAQLGEISLLFPRLVGEDSWRRSIASDPTAYGYSAYGILQDRKSAVVIEEGLDDLSSDDAYVWMNAAHYLGSQGRSEAIPYLIMYWFSVNWSRVVPLLFFGMEFGMAC